MPDEFDDSVQTPVAESDPLMVAWKAYQASSAFANTRRWVIQPEHTEGSLWAAFEQGWRARERHDRD